MKRVLLAPFCCLAVVAWAQSAKPTKADLDLGRKYLACAIYYGNDTTLEPAVGQAGRDQTLMAAFALMGQDTALTEAQALKAKMDKEAERQDATKLNAKRGADCKKLIDETYPTVMPRVLEFAKPR